MEQDMNALVDTVLRNASQLMDGVTTVSDMRGIQPKELESLYQFGLGFYRAGKMEEAEKVFKLLTLIEHTSAKYNIALAAVRQATKQYDLAIQGYALATMLDMHDPKPHFHAAECAFAKGDFEMAVNCLYSLRELCPAGTARNDEFRAKAEKLQSVLDRALGKVA